MSYPGQLFPFFISCGCLAYWSGIAPTFFWRMRGTLSWVFFLLSLFWRGAWHIRLEEAQISLRKEHRYSVLAKSVPRQGLANMPRQGIGEVPRQGTGKASQAGTAQRAQAGHWQTFSNWQALPRRELASVPGRACTLASVSRQETSKRPRQGLQMCPARALANVPRQGTVDIPRQGTVVVPRQETVGIAKSTAQISLATICHQPLRCHSTANQPRVV